MIVSSATPGGSLWRLWAIEARQKGVTLLVGIVLIVLLEALIAWRLQNPQFRVLVSLLVAGIPVLYWVFGGLAAFVGEFSSGAHLLLRSLPVRGGTVVLAKYLWLLFELLVLGGVLVGSALFFVNGVVPLAEIAVSPAARLSLTLLVLSALLVPPAIGLAASVVGQASRSRGLAAILAFALLWWAYLLLSSAVGAMGVLGDLRLDFARLPEEFCADGQACFVRINAALVAFQPLFAAVVLWLAGRTFETAER